jgi:hypothetical protein
MRKSIESAVAETKRKRVPKGTTKASLFKASRETLKKEMLAKKRIPKGIMGEAVRNVIREHNEAGFREKDLQGLLGPQKDNVSKWMATITKEFDTAWNQAIEKISKGKGKEIVSTSASSLVGSSRASSVDRSSTAASMDVDSKEDRY